MIGGNILTSLHDNTEIMLIDFELVMWNPEYYDLGNYLNEWRCDYAHPDPSCPIKYYFENRATEQDIRSLTKEYYVLLKQRAHPDFQFTDDTDETELKDAITQVKQCMVLHDLFQALCPMMMMSEQDETNPASFMWEYIRGRC